ncbi:cyclophilin-like domain-containing protein [Pisolithus orientalis]|uniref:cyclophilin-like domain-containing protein n=1 Tax=Pisolithus orientalis TaxID=936130 RepID=UPI0022254D10|nr:cyclophilin-like domain-containing protein [Pisolithus orientalis]KAI6010779.1 cyclophilin-like domain-containing protein [Pisolithus orientalis]
MALPTKGRVLIHTTAGEIDIELWSKETPKACRNFIALSLEGYYDGVIFHRVVPGFLVQTGDRTGTGAGGESFYGEPFEDEIHPRLRFAHRGLVGMANSGKKNTNDSQFFITLDRADELHGKHTLFGRVVGDTLYNALKIGEMELGENERPLYPPKIQSITIIENPFPDIVPRITAAEKRAQRRARETAQKEREEAERRRGAKKNVKLLSFADDEEADQDTEPAVRKKKDIARPDLIDNPSLSTLPALDVLRPPSPPAKKAPPIERDVSSKPEAMSKDRPKEKSKQQPDIDVTKIREQHRHEKASQKDAQRSEIEKMEAEIRRLTRRREGGDDSEEEAEQQKKKKPKSYLEEELSKYAKGRGLRRNAKDGRKKDEGGVLAALSSFRGMLQAAGPANSNLVEDADGEKGEEKVPATKGGEDSGMEVDDDRGFMSHVLQFPKDDGEESRKAERDYEVIDPRQRSAKAREEERERKRATKSRNGPGRSRR